MTRYIAPGGVIEVTADKAIAADEIVDVGGIIGPAVEPAANGAKVQVAVVGIFLMPCKGTDVVAAGAPVYWDPAESHLTTSSPTGSRLVGYAVGASANGVETVEAKLTGQVALAES
jgi:predicted RecA/RadA family phage recombinase